MKETKFYAADLHIHTPTSSCYKGPKDDDEYIKILKRYHNKNINIIAITDHNTIKGYKKLISIKEDINSKIKLLKELIKTYPDISNEIIKLEEDKKLFDEMLILPGIEFEATPGIHLLFIFDPNHNLKEIDDLLILSGYSDDIQGSEDPINVNIDVIKALSMAKNINALTIGAHVDSSKGIYNDLKGSYRATIFKSNDLDGISVNNTVTIEKIKNLIQQAEYKREKPLGIIQSSDHHHEKDCGKHIAYFQLENINFSSIKECFRSPIEKISATERPEIINIIKKIANDKNTYCIEKFSDEILYKAISAILNNNYGNILIGVTNDNYKNLKGFLFSEETFDKLINDIENFIKPEKIYYSITIDKYKYGSQDIINIKIINHSNKKFLLKNNYYNMSNNEIKELNTFDILEQQRKLTNNFVYDFHLSIDNKIDTIMTELELLSDTKDAYNIIQKIHDDSLTLSKVVDIEVVYPTNIKRPKLENINGNANGKYFFVSKHVNRTSDMYVRCSCPVIDEIEEIDEKQTKFRKGLSLVIVSGGATYIINQEKWKFINYDNRNPSLLLTINDEFKEIICPYTILAWVKSSLFLWMTNFEFNTMDIHNPKCFKSIKIPAILFESKYQILLKEKIENIIALEKKYLLHNFTDFETEFTTITNNHNKNIDIFAVEIDEIIYSSLLIKNENKDLIEKFLFLKNLYNLKEDELEDEI